MPQPTSEVPPSALEAALLAAWTAGEESLLFDTPMPLAAVEDTYFADSKRDGGAAFDMPDMPQVPASTDAGDFITIDETEELPF